MTPAEKRMHNKAAFEYRHSRLENHYIWKFSNKTEKGKRAGSLPLRYTTHN